MTERDTKGRGSLLDEEEPAGRGDLLEADTPITERLSKLFSSAPVEQETKPYKQIDVEGIVQTGQEHIAGVRAGLGALLDDPQVREQAPLVTGASAMADLALHWGTSLFGAAVGTVRGVADIATARDPAETQEAIGNFPEIFAETAEALTLGPMTPAGQTAAKAIDQSIQILGKARKGAGEWVFKETGGYEGNSWSPALATLAEATLAGVTMTLGPLAVGRMAKDIGQPGVGKRISKPTIDETPGPKIPDQPEMVLAEAVYKETRTAPAEALATVERGHITRAHRIARQRGIPYGEAIREVISQTKTPANMQHLVPVKGARELLIGEDTRTFSAMKASIFEDSVIPLADPVAAQVAGKLVGKRLIAPDIGKITGDFVGLAAPHKFVAKLHPVLKWGVDRIDRAARNVEFKANDILWGMELVPKRFGTARREGVPHKSERGMYTIFERLPLKDQIQLIDDAQPANLAGRAMTEAEKINWNGLQRLAYKQIRWGFDEALREVNLAAKATGSKGMQARPGYLSNIWTGDFRVFIRDAKSNKLVKTVGTSSRRQANAVKRGIEADMKGYKASVEPVKRRGKESDSVEAFQDAIRSQKKGSPEAQLLEQTFKELMAKRGFGKHRIQRKGIEGFMGSEGGVVGVRNFMKSGQLYVEGALRYAENMKAFHETNKVLVDPDMIHALPNTLDTLRKWREHATGGRGKVDQVISNWSRSVGMGETLVSRGLGRVNQITLISKLFMWNGRFLAAQGIQPYQMIPAKLVHLSSQGFEGSVIKSIAQAQKSFFFPDAGAAESIRFAVQNGTIAPKFVKELQDVLVTSKASWMTGDIPGLLTGQRLAGRIEEYSRMMANLMFYHFLKNSNVPHRTAVEGAAYLTDTYMVEYSTLARPAIYGSQGLGSLGKPVGLFKTFQHQNLSAIVEYAVAAKKGKPGALVTIIGSQVLAAGLQGIIGVVAVDNMLHALGLPTLTETLLKSDALPWLLWGPPSASIGMDLTTTLAAPGLGFGDFFSVPGYDYVGKAVASTFTWGVKRAKGTQNWVDSMKFWKSIAPSSMQSIIEERYTGDDGLTPHPTKHGYGTFRRDTRAWVARFMSARTLEESRALKGTWQVTRIEEREQLSIDQLVDFAALAMGRDEDVPDWVYNTAIDKYGLRSRAFQKMVTGRYKKASMTMIEQFTNFEKSRRGRQRAERLEEMGVTDPEGKPGRGDLLD